MLMAEFRMVCFN